MISFLENNWLSIVSILIGILVSYVFYRFQKNDSISASSERKKHALAELIDLVESYIINKQEVSEDVIDNLIMATERYHSVVLRPSCSAISMLQDVALRLQRSRHLDIGQKSEYSEKIRLLIFEVRNNARPSHVALVNFEIKDRFFELENLLKPGNEEAANKLFSEISDLIDKRMEVSLRSYEDNESFRKLRTIASSLLGITATLAVFVVGSKLAPELGTSIFVTKFVPILLSSALIGIAANTFISFLHRYQRKRNSG
jgi:hypothetical protein